MLSPVIGMKSRFWGLNVKQLLVNTIIYQSCSEMDGGLSRSEIDQTPSLEIARRVRGSSWERYVREREQAKD